MSLKFKSLVWTKLEKLLYFFDDFEQELMEQFFLNPFQAIRLTPWMTLDVIWTNLTYIVSS